MIALRTPAQCGKFGRTGLCRLTAAAPHGYVAVPAFSVGRGGCGMGFASGTVSFCRYFISSSRPSSVTDKFVEAVCDNAFGRHIADGDGVESGWITTRHLFDTDITGE